MKTLLLALALLSIGIAGLSQSTVTINTTGNRNKQVAVDGKLYTINNTTATDENEVVITDLAEGQHSLELVRTNTNNRRVSTKTSFNLRNGYDLTITIASNGSVSTSEQRTGRGNNLGAAITTNAYNRLYTQTKNKTSAAARASYLEQQFSTTRKSFTSRQASQLIQLINSESLRLKLAKQSYTKISDPQNFSLVSNLLSSTANRNDLNTYISSLPDLAGDGTTGEDETGVITDEKFKVIYNEVLGESTMSDRTYYLNNFFSRDFNHYTSAQARQLIELVTNEQDRLTLAKSAYRGITDRENYNVVYPLLSSSVNRSALVAYINSYNGSNPVSSMATAEFDKLYQSVYNQNGSTARYNLINTILTTPGRYFTTAQVKKLIALVNSESSRLQLSKTSYKVLVDRSNYTQLNDLLSTTASRNDLASYVRNYDNVIAGGVAMTDTDFNTLYSKVNNSWTSSSKFNLVSEAFKASTNYFTTAQVKQLLTLLSSENDRLSLAKNAYDNIVDHTNYTELYDLFTTTSYRNDLAAFVNSVQNGTGSVAKIPMADTEFKSMYRGVQLTFGIGAKYSALTEIFNTETNYFTVQQAKQLIQLVSSEGNRLELAKASYNNITDPTNFSSIYDVLSSQSSKNELTAYVNSNAYNN